MYPARLPALNSFAPLSPPHCKLRSVLRKLLRRASLFWLPYFTDFDHPPYLSRYLPFYPFSSRSPYTRRSIISPLSLSMPQVFTLVTLRPFDTHPNALRLVWFSTWYQSANQLYILVAFISQLPITFCVRLWEFALILTCALRRGWCSLSLLVCGLVSSIDWFQRVWDTRLFAWRLPMKRYTKMPIDFDRC